MRAFAQTDRFVSDVQARKLRPVYVFVGDEVFFRRRCREAVLKHLVPAELRGTAFGLYYTATGLALFPASLVQHFLRWVDCNDASAKMRCQCVRKAAGAAAKIKDTRDRLSDNVRR